MLEACKGHGYYTYSGSLTVSPYNECVIWIIPSAITKISARQVFFIRNVCHSVTHDIVLPFIIFLHQIDAFRSLYDDKWKNISGNCRQQQNLNRRRILFAMDDAVA